jgi:molybdopterin molybdotransferase
MSGHALPFRRSMPAMLAEPISLTPKLQHFLRGIVTFGPSGASARLTGPQGSGLLTSMARGNALLVIPEGQPETPAGAQIQAILLDDVVHQADPPF